MNWNQRIVALITIIEQLTHCLLICACCNYICALQNYHYEKNHFTNHHYRYGIDT